MDIYKRLKDHLRQIADDHQLYDSTVEIRCRALTPEEAIGTPDHDDYPISKGKEVMVEAAFRGAKGQAFSSSFAQADYTLADFLDMPLDTPKEKTVFVAGLNAVCRHLGICDKTVHCRDAEPLTCAGHLADVIDTDKKVLLVGYQPRFLETLAARQPVRVVDLDPDNIGEIRFGVRVESAEDTADAMSWCDVVLATGSTLANGSIDPFISCEKPVIFFGVTISAAAALLNLRKFCHVGH